MKVESYQGKVFDRMIERTPEIFGKKIGHYIPWEKATLLPWIQPAGGGYLNSTKFRGDNMQWDDTLSHKEIQELNNNDTVVLATKMTYSNTRDRYLGYALRKGELRDVMVLVEKAEDNPPSVYNKAKREAETLRGIGRHPNIVRLLYSSKPEDRTINVQEHIIGSDLETIIAVRNLQNRRDFPSYIFQQIIEGLKHIHDKGFLHRNLTPSNIFYSNLEGQEVKIGDFQNSERIDSIEEKVMPARESPKYESSRSCSRYTSTHLLNALVTDSPAKATVQSDINSLGRIISHLVTGESPPRYRIVHDEKKGKKVVIGDNVHYISLVEENEDGKVIKKFPKGISKRYDERKKKKLLKNAEKRHRDFLYHCMAEGENGFQNCDEVLDHLPQH